MEDKKKESSLDSVHSTPEWIEKLQNESWEAEMLISGGAIFGIFYLLDQIKKISFFFDFSTNIDLDISSWITIIPSASAFILLIGFILHLVLRGFWVGLIGMNYVFPDGINTDRLSFRGKFKNLLKEKSNIPMILKLDKFCSVIFAFTFVALFSTFSFFVFPLVIMILSTFVKGGSVTAIAGFFMMIFSFFSLLTLIDYITGSRLKRIKWLSYVYRPIHLAFSIITLSFLYRRLYYTIVSNIHGVYIFVIILATIGSLSLLPLLGNSSTGLSKHKFDSPSNNFGSNKLLTIKDQFVHDYFLDVTLTHMVRLENLIFSANKKKKSTLGNSFAELTLQQQEKIINDLYTVTIDGKVINDSAKWVIKEVNNDGLFKLKRIELFKSIDVSNLNNGSHSIEVTINIDKETLKENRIIKDSESRYNSKTDFFLIRPRQVN